MNKRLFVFVLCLLLCGLVFSSNLQIASAQQQRTELTLWPDTVNHKLTATLSTQNGGIISQGYAFDGTYHYAVTTTSITKYDRNWNVLAYNPLAAFRAGGNHNGGTAVANGKLYVIVTQDGTNYIEHVGIWSCTDLNFLGWIDLAKVANNPPSAYQTSAAGCTLDCSISNNIFYMVSGGGNPVRGSTIYKYDLNNNFAYLGAIQPSCFSMWNEGIDLYSSHFYITYVFSNTQNPAMGDWTTGGVKIMRTDGTNCYKIIPYSKFYNSRGPGKFEDLDVKGDYIRVLYGGWLFTFSNNPGTGYPLLGSGAPLTASALAGKTVRLYNSNGIVVQTGVTNSNGQVTFQMNGGNHYYARFAGDSSYAASQSATV